MYYLGDKMHKKRINYKFGFQNIYHLFKVKWVVFDLNLLEIACWFLCFIHLYFVKDCTLIYDLKNILHILQKDSKILSGILLRGMGKKANWVIADSLAK